MKVLNIRLTDPNDSFEFGCQFDALDTYLKSFAPDELPDVCVTAEGFGAKGPRKFLNASQTSELLEKLNILASQVRSAKADFNIIVNFCSLLSYKDLVQSTKTYDKKDRYLYTLWQHLEFSVEHYYENFLKNVNLHQDTNYRSLYQKGFSSSVTLNRKLYKSAYESFKHKGEAALVFSCIFPFDHPIGSIVSYDESSGETKLVEDTGIFTFKANKKWPAVFAEALQRKFSPGAPLDNLYIPLFRGTEAGSKYSKYDNLQEVNYQDAPITWKDTVSTYVYSQAAPRYYLGVPHSGIMKEQKTINQRSFLVKICNDFDDVFDHKSIPSGIPYIIQGNTLGPCSFFVSFADTNIMDKDKTNAVNYNNFYYENVYAVRDLYIKNNGIDADKYNVIKKSSCIIFADASDRIENNAGAVYKQNGEYLQLADSTSSTHVDKVSLTCSLYEVT